MREEIIKMAQEAGLIRSGDGWTAPHRWGLEEIERFFHMAQANALANIDPSSFMSYQEGVEAGRLAEREACAKLIFDIGSAKLAAAIRARGEQA